jgi:macrolide transport system ATP-binding/permease protein
VSRDRVPKPPRLLAFSGTLGGTGVGAGPVLVVRDLAVTGRLSLPRLDLARGERLLVTGGNGAGKSTLLRVLAGLLAPRDLARPVGALSLGQQRRLALAILVAGAPDLLLLDEPPNHVSPALADELEESLRHSPGTVVLASHDRWVRRRWEAAELALSPCAR